jgi:hypothetical protein
MKARTVWVIGTSVSIEDGGYVTHLSARLQERGIALRNLSVGDQTSVMGYMRTLGHLEQMAQGDVVVWEYSLLDTLLTERLFSASDVHSARRQAWLSLLERGVPVVVVLSAPRHYLDRLTDCERETFNDAKQLGLAVVDMRELFRSLGINDAYAHFRDDRHPRTDSVIVPATAEAVADAIENPPKIDELRLSAWRRKENVTCWRWIDSATLQKGTGHDAQTFRNSLVTVEAIPFSDTTFFRLPGRRSRVVAVGCVSAHDTGALWCGHPNCVATSVRLPDDLPYAFLLRVTAIRCQRSVETICGAMPAALANGVWSDYGQTDCSTPGTVAVFCILLEMEPSLRTRIAQRGRSILHGLRDTWRRAFRGR